MVTIAFYIDRISNYFRHLRFIDVSRALLVLFVLFLPFQIKTLVYNSPFYITGNFNPFSSFAIYINDLLLILSSLAWGISFWRKEEIREFAYGEKIFSLILLVLFVVMVLTTAAAGDRMLHFLMVLRFAELLLFYLLIVNEVVSPFVLAMALLGSMVFQGLVAIVQYLVQGSLGLKFLGEPVANITTLGVAKIDIAGGKILRSFGTFPHANVLGGTMVITLMLAFLYLRKYPWVLTPIVILLSVALLSSFSRGAFLALGIGILVFISIHDGKIPFRSILLGISVLLFFLVALRMEGALFQRLWSDDVASATERNLYMDIGKKMLFDNPLGVGLGGFTSKMQNYTDQKLSPWLFQPVHNIFLLSGDELGIAGGVAYLAVFVYLFYALVSLLYKTRSHLKRAPINRETCLERKKDIAVFIAMLLAFVVIGFFDHYIFTLYPGQVLLFFYLGLASNFASRFRLPAKNS